VVVDLHHDPAFRRPDLGAVDDILHRMDLLQHVVELGFGFAQFLHRGLHCQGLQMHDALVRACAALVGVGHAADQFSQVA
jgi:hypothetical protein